MCAHVCVWPRTGGNQLRDVVKVLIQFISLQCHLVVKMRNYILICKDNENIWSLCL
jgi:hypothetical protein